MVAAVVVAAAAFFCVCYKSPVVAPFVQLFYIFPLGSVPYCLFIAPRCLFVYPAICIERVLPHSARHITIAIT